MLDLFYPPQIPELKPTYVHTLDDGPRYSVIRVKVTPEERRQYKAQWMREKRAKEKS